MKLLFCRINCLLCDLCFSYVLLYPFLFIKPSYIPFFSAYFLVVSIYFLITYFLFKRSLFQYFFKIEIARNPKVYTFVKVALIGLFPFILTYMHSITITTLLLVLLVLPNIFTGLIRRKSIGQVIARASIQRNLNVVPKIYYIIGVCLIALIPFIHQSVKEYGIYSKEKTYFSNTRISLPLSVLTKAKYANNIVKHKENPKDYVMRLFDKYDIVVLCERLHPEYTQWEFFSQLILNDDFADKVGHVCTEFGRSCNQPQLEKYLSTVFDSEEELKKATAAIVRENGSLWPLWDNKNIYDFILNLYKYNHRTKDSCSQVMLHFSDIAKTWNNITSREEWENVFYRIESRDSIMATNIIHTYNRLLNDDTEKGKLLVVVNTRHAFKDIMPKDRACIDYLCKAFPSKTACVLINGTTQLLMPMKSGMWDEVSLALNDFSWAIDFENCSLGNEFFDLFPIPTSNNRKYKNLFNGIVYYEHPSNFQREYGYEYMLENFKDTLLHRSAVLGDNYLAREKQNISRYELMATETDKVFLFKIFNILFLTIHYIVLVFLGINLAIVFIRELLKQRTKKFGTA